MAATLTKIPEVDDCRHQRYLVIAVVFSLKDLIKMTLMPPLVSKLILCKIITVVLQKGFYEASITKSNRKFKLIPCLRGMLKSGEHRQSRPC